MLNLNFIGRTGYNVRIHLTDRIRKKVTTEILDRNVLDTVVLLKVIYQFVCMFFNSILTNNFNDDPYHSLNVNHLVSSVLELNFL